MSKQNFFFDESSDLVKSEEEECETSQFNAFRDLSRTNQSGECEIEEHIRILKVGILRTKLTSVVNIFKKRVEFNFAFFVERMKLKIEMLNFFNKDDNYLYILPKPKLFRFRTIYAYRRLVYVLKKFKYRNNFILKNVFMRWKDLLINTTSLKENASQNKIKKFILIIENIFSKFTHQQKLLTRLIFLTFKFNCKNINDENYKFENYPNSFDLIHKLKEIFKKKRMRIMNLFKSEKIQNLKFTKILFKRFLLNFLNFINLKRLRINFSKWKKYIFMSSYKDTIVNSKQNKMRHYNYGVQFLVQFLISKFNSSSLFKRQFFERLIFKIKIQNTLKDYSKKYKNIPKLINDNCLKDKILFLRRVFNKMFALNKVIMTGLNKKYKLPDRNYFSNYKTVQPNQNENHALVLCFYKLKRQLLDQIKSKVNKFNNINYLFSTLRKKILNIKNNFFQILRYDKVLKQENINSAVRLINVILICNFKKSKSYAFNNIRLFIHIVTKYNKILAAKKIIFYTKVCELNKKKHKDYFNQWKSQLNNPSISLHSNCKISNSEINAKYEKSNKVVLKLHFLMLRKYDRDLKYHFIKFKMNTKAPNQPVFIKSEFKSKIDFQLILNQSKVLLELENEENRLKSKLQQFKTSLNKPSLILFSIICLKQIKMLSSCFKIWQNDIKQNVGSKSNLFNTQTGYLKLLEVSDNIQNHNEELMEVYRAKNKEYKKTIEDFQYVQGHFCEACVGEPFDIDYKSIEMNEDSDIEDEGTKINKTQIVTQNSINLINNYINDQVTISNKIDLNSSSCSPRSLVQTNVNNINIITNLTQTNIPNQMIQKTDKLITAGLNRDTLAKNISEMETQIRNLQMAQESRIIEQENQIKIFEEKKLELLSIKEKILKSKMIK